MSAQLKFLHEVGLPDDRRSRKKLQTRRAIEKAALSLCAERGYDQTTVEQISDLADVSTATFFRYFPSKADAVLCQQGAQIPLLQQTILDLPAGDSEITVVRVAIHKVWVPAIDAERTRSTAKAAASSAVLRGMYGDINRVWMAGVAEALARRKGLESTDARSKAMARVTLAIFGGAIETWVAGKCLGNLPDVIDREFAMVESLFAEAAKMSG